MMRYITLELDEAEKALLAQKADPIILDGKLMGLKLGNLRVVPLKTGEIAISIESPPT